MHCDEFILLGRAVVSGFRRPMLLAFALLCIARLVAAEELDDLVQLLLERNPSIQAARRVVDARRAMVTPARTLPEPNISFETMGNLVPPTLQGGDPSSARVLRFTQEFPFPGKLSLQGQIASAEADAAMWKYEEVRREAVAELKMAYYDLCLARMLAEIAERSKEVMQQFSEISTARYKVGQGAQQDLLKAQLEISRLTDRLTVLEREKAIAQARINTLLYRPSDFPIGLLAGLSKPEFAWTLDQLYAKAMSNNPQLRMNRKEIDRSELSVALAKKSFYPDFEVGFSYYNRTDMPEMYGLMIKAKVPLYFWRRQRPELEAAATDLLGQKRTFDSTVASVHFRVKDSYLRTTTADQLLELYGKAIIPQAALTLESSLSSYRVGAVDFLTLLNNENTVLEYEMKYCEVLVDYYKALVNLETLTGEILTAKGTDPRR